METCERCFTPLTVGAHGVGVCPFEPRRHGAAIVPDDVPGGFVVENGFETPQRFYSHSAHRAALAARGLEIRAKWAGEHDRHLTRWDTVDLEAAKALLERGSQARRARAAVADFPITVTESAETFRYEVDR